MIELVTVGRMALLWLVITHTCACVRILFAVSDGYGAMSGSWKVAPEWERPHSTCSVRWCLGLMTGMADGSLPLTTPQFYFTIFIMTAGVFLFAYGWCYWLAG